MDQKTLEDEIDALELDEMGEEDIERVVKSYSQEGLDMRRERKKIRYRLSRIQTMINGGPDAEDADGIRERFESMIMFNSCGGWRMFGVTWDVALDDPFRIVGRDHSRNDEWDSLMKSKFPTLHPDGRVEYPDIKVQKKVEAAPKPKRKKKGKRK